MHSCPHCSRDLHDAPLSERVAQMYAQHVFDPDYSAEEDLSPIVCVGSFTEGPPRPPKTDNQVVYFSTGDLYKAYLTSQLLYGSTTIMWQPLNDQAKGLGSWKIAGTADNFHVKYTDTTSWEWKGATWTLYDESYNFVDKWVGTFQSGLISSKVEECKVDTVIEFGPKWWVNKEPPQMPKSWPQVWPWWFQSVPRWNDPCWKEPVQLPATPEPDWKALAEEINADKSYTKFLVGVK